LVSTIEWSPDSNFLLVGVFKRGIAYVKCLNDNEWNCKIDEGLAGLVSCCWTPDSRHVLTVSEFKLRLTAWSLIDKKVCHIKNPKHEKRGVDFSPDGKLMAVAERGEEGGKDQIGLYVVT